MRRDAVGREEDASQLPFADGEFVAIVGPTGCGKSTLLNVIACILDPSQGRMMLDGEVVFDQRWLRSDLRRLRLEKIGFIFQFHNLLPFLNAADNVALVLHLAMLRRLDEGEPAKWWPWVHADRKSVV